MGSKKQALKVKISFNNPTSTDGSQTMGGSVPSQQSELDASQLGAYALSERQRLAGETDSVEDQSETYQYHYGRILAAALFLLVFFLVIAWGSVRYKSSVFSDQTPRLAEEQVINNELADTKTLSKSEDVLNVTTKVTNPSELSGAIPSNDELREQFPVKQVSGTLEAPGAVKTNQQGPISSQITSSQTQAKLLTDTDAVSAQAIKPEAQESTSDVVSVKVYNSQLVGRAKLSPKLVDKDPVGEVSSPILLGKRSIIRVYFSTRLDNAYGEKYFHVWYLNGRERARVPLSVTSQSWRGNSSKYINRAILGEWQVKLESEAGDIFAESAFEVFP